MSTTPPAIEAALDLDALEKALKVATALPWDMDGERDDDTRVEYQNIGATGPDGKWVTLFDSLNSTAQLIEEDYDEDYSRLWDIIAERNAKLLVLAVNSLPSLLSAACELATIRAERDASVTTDQRDAVAKAIHEARFVVNKPLPMGYSDRDYCGRLADAAIAALSAATPSTAEAAGYAKGIEAAAKGAARAYRDAVTAAAETARSHVHDWGYAALVIEKAIRKLSATPYREDAK